MTSVLKKVHAKVPNESLYKQLIIMGYYSTVEADAASLARRCRHVNLMEIEATLSQLNYIACPRAVLHT